MFKRNKMRKSRSKRLFRRTATKTNRRNVTRGPSAMRGGIRL